MSNAEIESLLATLSPEDKAELRDRLNAEAQLPPMTDEELAEDPAIKFLEELQSRTPLNLPADFGLNHNHYIHGASKIDE